MQYGTINPIIQLAYEGSSATFHCSSLTQPNWSKEGYPVKNATFILNLLLLTQVKETDSGEYTCEGTLNKKGKNFTKVSTLLVGGEYVKSEYSIVLRLYLGLP